MYAKSSHEQFYSNQISESVKRNKGGLKTYFISDKTLEQSLSVQLYWHRWKKGIFFFGLSESYGSWFPDQGSNPSGSVEAGF